MYARIMQLRSTHRFRVATLLPEALHLAIEEVDFSVTFGNVVVHAISVRLVNCHLQVRRIRKSQTVCLAYSPLYDRTPRFTTYSTHWT